MKRPLCIATVFYILGIIMGLYLQISIALFTILLAIVIILYVKFNNKKFKLKENKNCILKFMIFTLILIMGLARTKQIDSKYEKFYKSIQEEIQVKAIVVSSPKEKDYSYTYEIKILKINESEQYKGIKLILNLKKSKQKENAILQYGDYITAKGEFEIPNTARNYGGFDYREYLKCKKIYGTIYVKDYIEVTEKEQCSVFEKIIFSIQSNIKENIGKVLSKETKDLCVGILIGDKDDLSEEIQSNFKNSNLTHMLAVSGSHVTYIILGLTVLLSKADKRLSKVITILFLIFFMAITGFTASVTRACIMGIIMLISKLVYRKSDIWTNLALSTLIILVINPYTILDTGFQLSYGGTIGIVLLSKRISDYIKQKTNIKNKLVDYIIDTIVVTVSANIIIIPIMAFKFNTISLTFWISNLLASPLMGIVVILGFAVYLVSVVSISISKIIAIPLNVILVLLLKIAEVCHKIPFSSIIVKTPYIISIILYYYIIILILNRKMIIEKINIEQINIIKRKFIKLYVRLHKKNKIFKYFICFSIIVSLILGTCIHNTNRKLTIYFIDVGQGDSTLIITPNNKKILIDGGGSELGNFNVGEKILLPYLLDRRITTLDYVMISHFDSDHVRTDYYM